MMTPFLLLLLTGFTYFFLSFFATQYGAADNEVLFNLLRAGLGVLGIVSIIAIPIGFILGLAIIKKGEIALSGPKYAQLSPEQVKEIQRFSWTGLLFTTVFTLGNRMWLWAFGSIIPIFSVYVMFRMGLSGRQMAWEREKGWQSFEQYSYRQKLLMTIGIILTIISFTLQIWVETL